MRTYVKDFTVRVKLPTGVVETHGRLLPIQVSGRKEGEYKLCTKDGVPVQRRYVDPTDDFKVVDDADLRRYIPGSGKKEDAEPEVKRILTPEEYEKVTEAKKSQLDLNVANVTIHRADAMDELWPAPDRKSFVIVPNNKDQEHVFAYATLYSMVEAGYILVTHCNVNHHEALFALTAWRGHLVLQPMIYTDGLNPHEQLTIDIDRQVGKVAAGVAAAMAVDFKPEDYVNSTLERVRAAEAGDEVPEDERASKRNDSMAAMQAFLDAQ